MILNAYAVLDGFISLLRLTGGLLIIVLAVLAWRQWRRGGLPAQRQSLEDRFYLLFLLAFLLFGLNVICWPILYLLLQSYVTQWPDVMCIYGVTQVGRGTLGPSRFLPGLLEGLQLGKPALVFVAGLFLVMYWLNRRTATGPLLGRILLVLLALGVLNVLDAGAEIAYLVIPKKEEFLSAGCCTVPFDAGTSRFVPTELVNAESRSLLYAAYYGVNIGMVLLLVAALRSENPLSWKKVIPLGVGALLSVAVNGLFLVEIAAPHMLQRPEHHCPYDLIPQVPESMAGVALFLFGCLSVGWALLARVCGRTPETTPFLPELGRVLYSCAIFGYLFSLVLISTELML